MGLTTGIEWCDSTLNLQMGCDGCELWRKPKPDDEDGDGEGPCYAAGLVARYAGLPGWPTSFGQPKIFPERMKEASRWPDLTGKERPDKPWLNGYPRVIFLNDMGDTWTESLDLMWLAPFVPTLAATPHIYIFLTKRPGRAVHFWARSCLRNGALPPNFWFLTSVTGPENIGRIRELLKLRALGARVLGVSYEPVWGPVDFRSFMWPVHWHWDAKYRTPEEARTAGAYAEQKPQGLVSANAAFVDWLIAGGESGAGAKPSHPDWFRAARDACHAAGVAFFFKQWGEWAPHSHGFRDGGNLDWGTITASGEFFMTATPWNGHDDDGSGEPVMIRVGKKAAGAMLDGREWRQMPEWRP